MNKDRLLEVANLIEKAPPDQFHMGSWFGTINDNDWRSSGFVSEEGNIVFSEIFDIENKQLICNTTACIAGWAVALKYDFKPIKLEPSVIYEEAKEYLDLNSREAQALFHCTNDSIWAKLQDEYGYQVVETVSADDPNFDFDYESGYLYYSELKDIYYAEIPAEEWIISNIEAAHVLKRIAKGEVTFDE